MFILKGYEIGFSIRFYYGLVCRNWVSHKGLTKTMPEFTFKPFHRSALNAEGYDCIVLQLCIIRYMSRLFLW